jgi:Bacterial PH domain
MSRLPRSYFARGILDSVHIRSAGGFDDGDEYRRGDARDDRDGDDRDRDDRDRDDRDRDDRDGDYLRGDLADDTVEATDGESMVAEQAAATGEVRFAVPTRVMVLKFGLAAGLAMLGLIASNRPQLVLGLGSAAAVAAYAARDVVARQRLRADREGLVTVRGYAGRRRLAWSEIERVRVDTRTRLGASSELLEIDADEEIFLFSRFDLGVDPSEAVEALQTLRDGSES